MADSSRTDKLERRHAVSDRQVYIAWTYIVYVYSLGRIFYNY